MKKKTSGLKNLVLITQIGLNASIPVLISLWIGISLDKKLSTRLVFTIIFLILGFLASIRNIYKIGLGTLKNVEDEEDD